MDARSKFNKESVEYNNRTCIVVVEVYDRSIGIIVDEVSEVMNIDEENIVSPPNVGGNGRRFIQVHEVSWLCSRLPC